ncbi:MAG: T9SS type A sorting domain-containing protein [Bacteroidota bacterium]
MLKKITPLLVLLLFAGTTLHSQDPTVPAPVPNKAAEDVLSVYSDAYTSITEILFPDWGQSTSASEIQIESNKTLKYANLTYMGLQYFKSDINYLEYVHLDYYTSDAATFKFTIVVTGNEKAYNIGTTLGIIKDQWVSVDIPLSYFSTLNLANAFQFKTEGDGTIYLDNLYFWKDPTTEANDFTLSNLTVDGVTVAGFAPRTFTYLADLASGTTTIPTVSATTSSPTATTVITQATALPGSATVVVNSADLSKTRTYKVNIQATVPPTAAPSPTNAPRDVVSIYSDAFTSIATDMFPNWSQNTIASEIQLEGNNTLKYYKLNYMGMEYNVTDLSGYDSLHLDYFTTNSASFYVSLITKEGETLYNVKLKKGLVLNQWTSINIPLDYYDATRDLTQAYQLKIQGTNTVYLDNIFYWKIPTLSGQDVTLADLTVDGITISGFNTARDSYILDFPYGTTTVPEIAVTTTDPGATYVITPAEGMPGKTTIVVTSYDQTVTATYTVEFTTTIPPVAAPTPDKDADFVISVYGDAYNSIATNVNPNWGQETIVTEFQIESNNTLKYARLNYQGMDYPNPTDVSEMEYLHVDFFTGDATALEIFLIAAGENSYNIATQKGITFNTWNSVDIPMNVYSSAGRDLTAAYQFKVVGNGTVYFDNFYFFKVNPATDATLRNLKVDGKTVNGFDAAITDYTCLLGNGTTNIPVVEASTTNDNATVSITDATSLPGTTTVLVTAADGVTTRTYTLNFEFAPVGMEDFTESELTFYPNPASDKLWFKASCSVESLSIFDISGRNVLNFMPDSPEGSLDIQPLKGGLYIVKAQVNGQMETIKLVVK